MKIVCVGECVVDKYPNGIKKIGGTSFNVAKILKKLNPDFDVSIATAVGNDENGALIKKEVENKKINSIIETLEGESATQLLNIKQDGEKEFTSYSAGVLQEFRLNSKQIQVIKNSDVLITVCFKQIESLFSETINVGTKGIIAADFTDLSDYDKNLDIINKHLPNIDIVFLGLKSNETKLIQNLSKLANEKNKLIVITLAEQGAVAFSKGKIYRIKAENVPDVIDTTGAGDAFIAGFIKTYLDKRDIDKSLKSGSIESSKVIQKIGI